MRKNIILNTELTDEQIALFYLGQEGMLLKFNDKYLLIDAYLSDYVDQHCCTDTVKWLRKYEAPINAEELDFVDYVLCTHEHFDHMDPYTLSTIAKINQKALFIAPQPVKETLYNYGITPDRVIGAIADARINVDGFSIIPIPAAHEELHPDSNGHYLELGYKITAGNKSLYHAGDCCIYAGLIDRLMDIDVMMVPINGRSYFKRYEDDTIGNMTCEEAVILAKRTNAKLLVPMHYDLYEINGVNPSHFVDTLYALNPSQKFYMFDPGECYIIEE